MASLWYCVAVLGLVARGSVNADMKLDCKGGFVTLVWTDGRSQMDTSLLRLGSCFPTSLTDREAVFTVDFNDCNFRRLVTGKRLIYANDLTYITPPNSVIPSYIDLIVCEFERPRDWYPLVYEPVFSTYGLEELVFHIGLMNANFSGPAESTRFPLGSIIAIMASVEQQTHQPLLLLIDECVAATTPELQPESSLYPLITNKGCLVDSKKSRSKFEPRQKTSEIRLSLQAFKFAVGGEVFIHCSLVAWDPNGLGNTKKACHYIKDYGWELLDDPTHNSLCDCCESSCKARKTRDLVTGKHGAVQNVVLGPLTITD
ncbi:zona pellucida sperm-binding protein 3 [Haplochromis burtoni]|uniref:zona pellucida sperm-binding protein 3 n=1 Tax=Haplochromis burtoni TaxID=8153 RepID=UPI0003BCB9AC|nr:zona pellucida sperm-binding protein 3 [Haplochromis burtoni]